MILCITPNPAIDRTLTVTHLQLDGVNRAGDCRVAAGGKGINVARAARTLGQNVLCAGFLGGMHGALLSNLMQQEGLPAHFTPIAGETRTCTILLDPGSGHNTVINEQGPDVTDDDWRRLIAGILQDVSSASAVCLSGSTPPGSPLPRYQELLIALRDEGKPVWVDVAGAPLAVARELTGIHLKVNRDEAEALLKQPLDNTSSVVLAAQELVQEGAASCTLTLGADGAVLATPAGCWWAQSASIRRVNAVASGDSFLAGLVAATQRELPPATALAWATAAGAANAAFGGGAQFTRVQFEASLAGVAVRETRA